ncbi:MAG: YcjF family protein [Xanthobacteraceae bacterium]
MADEPFASDKAQASAQASTQGSPEFVTPHADRGVTDESRDEIAARLVDRFALWGGGAGLIPIPLVDVASVAGVQIQMLRRLSAIYDVPFSDNRGKSLIAGLVGSTIPATSGMGFASVLKAVPLVGTAVGSLIMPALSAAATYAIGKVFIRHFSSGGTLLDFEAPKYADFFRTQKEKWAARRSAKMRSRATVSEPSPTPPPHETVTASS